MAARFENDHFAAAPFFTIFNIRSAINEHANSRYFSHVARHLNPRHKPTLQRAKSANEKLTNPADEYLSALVQHFSDKSSLKSVTPLIL